MLQIRQFTFNEECDFSGFLGSPTRIGEISFADLKNNYKPINYISFDGLGIDLEDENKVFYDDGYVGFLSCDVSNDTKTEDGYMIPNSTSGLIIDFSSTGGPLPPDLTLLFYGHCCSKIWLQYSNIESGTAYEEYIDVTDADAHIKIKTKFQDMLTGISSETTSLKLVCLATPLPNQAVKLQSIIIGTTVLLNNFKSANLLEEINVLSDDLPANSFECDVVTDEPIFKDDVLIVYSNGKFYGNFFVDEFSRVGKNIYSIKALNTVGRLDDFQFEDWTDTTLKLDGTVGNTANNGFLQKLEKDTKVSIKREDNENYWVFGHVPINTYRYALCAFAYACRYMIDGARSDEIKLIKIPTEISSVIRTKSNRIIGECTFTKSQVVTKAVYEYPWDYTVEYKKLETPYIQKNTYTKFYFDDAPVKVEKRDEINQDIEITANTLNYIWFKALVDNPDIDIQKINLVKLEKTVEYENVTAKTKTNVKKYNTFNIRGSILSDNDDLSGDYVETLAKEEDIKRFINSRGTASARIIVENEKPGDLIQIETTYGEIITGIITSMNIVFGFKDIADIEVLEWQNG